MNRTVTEASFDYIQGCIEEKKEQPEVQRSNTIFVSPNNKHKRNFSKIDVIEEERDAQDFDFTTPFVRKHIAITDQVSQDASEPRFLMNIREAQ